MKEERINAYEGLFLFPQALSADLQAAVDHVKDILTRAGCEIISLRKWDERRLAFEIKGNKRGVYILVYFKVRRSGMTAVERGCNLSETMLRSMFLRCEHLTQDQMQSADGQAELADEIRLRSIRAATAQAEEPGDDDRDRDEDAVTIEAESSRDTAPA